MRTLELLVLSSLLACEARVIENDGGASSDGGAPSSSANGASSADGGGSASGASSADGGGSAGGGPDLFDAIGACEETCNRPSVGGPSICVEACVAAIEPNCEREAFANYECAMWYCDPACDAEQLESDLRGCLNPFYCGHAGNELECDWDSTTGACDCVGQCDDGHVGRIVCPASGPCDCYFDGELVATCVEDDEWASCDYEASCCAGFMLPGGGPAAGEL